MSPFSPPAAHANHESSGALWRGALSRVVRSARPARMSSVTPRGSEIDPPLAPTTLAARADMPRERILVVDDSPTILKLVQLALTKADFEVMTAAGVEAARAAVRESPPALVLLDSLLPLEGSPQPAGLAGELGADPQLSHIPVVVMSAYKGDVQDERTRPPNVVDAISKPFSAEALVAVVTHALAKHDPQAPLLGEEAIDLSLLSLVPETAPPPPESEVVDPAVAALAGDLRLIGLADVLTLLSEEGHTGTLRVARDDARLRVYFRRGRIEFANAEGVPEEFLLGRFLRKTGAVDEETLVAALEARRSLPSPDGQPLLLGRFLVDRGLVSARDLGRAVGLQTTALVFESLRWGAGRFTFMPAADLPGPALDAALGLSVPALLLEGFRRVDEWRLIERELGDFDSVFVREEERLAGLPKGQLTRDELTVWGLCDGRRTVRELLDRSPLGAFDTIKMLYRLLKIRVIRRRVPPVAA